MDLALRAVWAFAVVALLLVALTYIVRMLNRSRIVAATG